jgi:hypothetical protein
MSKRSIFVVVIFMLLSGALVGWSVNNQPNRVQAAPDIFASPIQAGCYIAAPADCRIHADPFTITIASGQKLVTFRLVAINITKSGTQTAVYDFRTDQSNPVPFIGTTYTPSLVSQDFAATCGDTYQLSLQGQDSGDPSLFNLGLTNSFTCPTGVN